MIWRKCFCLTLYFWPQWVLTLTFQVSQINFCLVDGFFIQKVYICEQAKIVFHWTKYLSNCLYFLSLTISAELGLCRPLRQVSHKWNMKVVVKWRWSITFLAFKKSLCLLRTRCIPKGSHSNKTAPWTMSVASWTPLHLWAPFKTTRCFKSQESKQRRDQGCRRNHSQRFDKITQSPPWTLSIDRKQLP